MVLPVPFGPVTKELALRHVEVESPEHALVPEALLAEPRSCLAVRGLLAR